MNSYSLENRVKFVQKKKKGPEKIVKQVGSGSTLNILIKV
jgi:hypothetical protein